LRGLHFQKKPFAQAKLVRCVRGAVFDVAVDLRKESESFGLWFGVQLTSDLSNQLFVPKGVAHGFLVITNEAEVEYIVDSPYNKNSEVTLKWDDEIVGVIWPDVGKKIISDKDLEGLNFKECVKLMD